MSLNCGCVKQLSCEDQKRLPIRIIISFRNDPVVYVNMLGRKAKNMERMVNITRKLRASLIGDRYIRMRICNEML